MADSITVMVNGFQERVPADATIDSLIAIFKELDRDLIVEHNGRFVYPREYPHRRIATGDRIEFINPNFGG
jgi:thiamine biosynthesis protein ThiS